MENSGLNWRPSLLTLGRVQDMSHVLLSHEVGDMGSSSAILRRCSGLVGILQGASRNSFCGFKSDTAMTAGVESPPAAPWLMLPPAADGSGSITYRFQCLLPKKEEFTFTNKIGSEDHQLQLPVDINVVSDVVWVGSSHGWLALYNRRNSDLFLSNPIADQHLKLPPLHTLGPADRVILSSDEREALAFMTFGPRRRIAFCSPRRSNEWTLLSGGGGEEDGAYRNLAYSKKHKRLLCVREEEDDEVEGPRRRWGGSITLEGWDFDGNQPPIRDWAIRHSDYEWPLLNDLKNECFQMKYLVCCGGGGEAEEEELWFLVVRHVNLEAGPKGSLEEKIWLSKYRGCHYIRTPYKTIGFDVFKIDFERGELVEMKDNSLGGLAVFVGINHSFALPAAGLGLRPDSVYFTDENRVVEPTRLERTNYGGHDNGIFDYRTKEFHSCCDLYPVEFERIRKILPLPLWFTPTPATII